MAGNDTTEWLAREETIHLGIGAVADEDSYQGMPSGVPLLARTQSRLLAAAARHKKNSG